MSKIASIIGIVAIFYCNVYAASSNEPSLHLPSTSLANGETAFFTINVPDEKITHVKVEGLDQQVFLATLPIDHSDDLYGFIAADYAVKPGNYNIQLSWFFHKRVFSKKGYD